MHEPQLTTNAREIAQKAGGHCPVDKENLGQKTETRQWTEKEDKRKATENKRKQRNTKENQEKTKKNKGHQRTPKENKKTKEKQRKP